MPKNNDILDAGFYEEPPKEEESKPKPKREIPKRLKAYGKFSALVFVVIGIVFGITPIFSSQVLFIFIGGFFIICASYVYLWKQVLEMKWGRTILLGVLFYICTHIVVSSLILISGMNSKYLSVAIQLMRYLFISGSFCLLLNGTIELYYQATKKDQNS